MDSKKQKLRKRDQTYGLQRQRVGRGDIEGRWAKVQTSSFKLNKHWGCDVQHDDYS